MDAPTLPAPPHLTGVQLGFLLAAGAGAVAAFFANMTWPDEPGIAIAVGVIAFVVLYVLWRKYGGMS